MVVIWLIKGVLLDVILNTAKHYYENDEEGLSKEARDKYRNLSEEEKIKRQNMEKTVIRIWLKKKNKDEKNIKKIITRQESLNLIMNKIFLVVI